MTKRDLCWRVSGAALFAAACGTSLIHKHVIAQATDAPASALEACLALITFVTASLGVVLLINGVRLRDTWRAEHERARRDRAGSPRDYGAIPQVHPATSDPVTFDTGRDSVGAYLAWRALDPAARADGATVHARAPRR